MKRTWWKRLVTRRPRTAVQHRSYRLRLEPLEERCQPSVTGFRPGDEVGNNPTNIYQGVSFFTSSTEGTTPADVAGGDLLRFSAVAYGDGISKPSMGGGAPTFIASPRTVSNDVSNQATTLFGPTDTNTIDGNGLSDFGYTWGQFLDHDMDLTPDGGAAFNIPADPTHNAANPPTDPFGPADLLFTRAKSDPNTGTSTSNPLQQINVNTSYLDLSQVYGSTQTVADALRVTNSNGSLGYLLKTSDNGLLLPLNNLDYFTQDQLTALNMANDAHLVDSTQLFAAGDVRANENIELMALQTLFVRNHNRIAGELAQQDPTQFGLSSWTDETLYQEARKLNIATEQMITYQYYLPDVLGPTALPAYTGYDPTVDASIATEFSTVGFRFGHSLLNNSVNRDNNDGTPIGSTTLQLSQDFFDPNLVNPAGGDVTVMDASGNTSTVPATDIGPILKGDADGTAQAMDAMAVESIRSLLFGDGGNGGQDLIARDLWRAHDDGIGTYNRVAAYYNNIYHNVPQITNDATQGFDQLTSDPTLQQELATAYNSKPGFQANGKTAGDIDPFAAGIAQDHVPGSDLGPLFTDILVDQFSRLATGDQYFYLNETFTPAEQAILGQANTLGGVIAANTSITLLQSDVFLNPTLSQQNAQQKGDYTSTTGRTELTGSPTGTLLSMSLYNNLITALDPNNTGTTVLVDANGNQLSDAFFQSYANVQSYLKSKNTGTAMGFKLSLQLLTAEFNVLLNNVDATSSIYVPAVTLPGTTTTLSSTLQSSLITNGVSTASGVANIQNILKASIAELQLGVSGDTTFEEALKDCLDGINNNEAIFIL
jgi:hypothetical protein